VVLENTFKVVLAVKEETSVKRKKREGGRKRSK
jgi:hypothetical protein